MTEDRYGFCVNTLTMCPSFTAVYNSVMGTQKGFNNPCEGFGIRKPTNGVAISDFLVSMGVRTTAFGFLGGILGNYLKDFLKERGIGCGFLESSSQTLIKTAVSEGGSLTVFEPAENRIIQVSELFALTKAMRESEPCPEYFVLSGSYPRDLEMGTYCDLIKMLHGIGIKVVTDFSGPDMRLSFREKPFLTVMGPQELYEYTFKRAESFIEALVMVKNITKETGAAVLCHFGTRGAIYSSPDCLCTCAVKRNKNESVYCRPSFIAAFIKAYEFSGNNIPYAMQYAAAYSAAVNETGDIPDTDAVKKNFNNVDFRTY